jgi:hypothetical protein
MVKRSVPVSWPGRVRSLIQFLTLPAGRRPFRCQSRLQLLRVTADIRQHSMALLYAASFVVFRDADQAGHPSIDTRTFTSDPKNSGMPYRIVVDPKAPLGGTHSELVDGNLHPAQATMF